MAKQLSGPSNAKEMAKITLKGNSYQRGVQYGKTFGKYLKDFYYWFAKKDPGELLTEEYRAVLQHHEEMTAKHFPQLLEEVKGWADGAKLPYEMCKILVFHNEIKGIVRRGCSNVLVTGGPEGPWLAKNSDQAESEVSWMIQKTVLCDDCLSHMGMGYLGVPGLDGINEAGLAKGGSSMSAAVPKEVHGMPNFPSYLLATQRTVADCCRQLEQIGAVGKGIHLILLDASGDAAAIEIGGGEFHIRRPNETGVLVVTNHSASGSIPIPDPPALANPEKTATEGGRYLDILDNSWARYGRLMEIVCSAPPSERTTDLAKRAMSDHYGRQNVCQHVPGWFSSIYSMIFSPGKDRSRAQICWGPPCSGNFISFDFPPIPE